MENFMSTLGLICTIILYIIMVTNIIRPIINNIKTKNIINLILNKLVFIGIMTVWVILTTGFALYKTPQLKDIHKFIIIILSNFMGILLYHTTEKLSKKFLS